MHEFKTVNVTAVYMLLAMPAYLCTIRKWTVIFLADGVFQGFL